MFTGIITDVGTVESVVAEGALKRVRISCAYPAKSIDIGASIATGGPCLTVVARGEAGGRTWYDVDVGAETLERTNAGAWEPGTRLNIERSLKIGDELGGHIVTGHIDGVAKIVSVAPFDGMSRFVLAAPAPLARFIAEKGSVALDGTSLTVNSVDGNEFSVLLIPHTLAVTTWGARKAGDGVNLEVDLMARYAARLAETK
ncbi:riboflavin synthase [Methylovirgula ligni]|uniref:Riboflavin synthase n=1 Tax=Methylovirgula ligni TaxID=569860 RepID=A0A3D9YUG2_9HYPH|nr:riboflavin synthase [Methylovirgula ligni]QAY96075.1 riboflavin synthase [Methylovirgula ligni]REF86246.1 riboflavin synthase alpha chain [Methylovirgula ligni]